MSNLSKIKKQFNKDLTAKYNKGKKEHGGSLIHKANLIDKALEEAIDQVCYLYTLKEQIERET